MSISISQQTRCSQVRSALKESKKFQQMQTTNYIYKLSCRFTRYI